jgi:hypothetical protein
LEDSTELEDPKPGMDEQALIKMMDAAANADMARV